MKQEIRVIGIDDSPIDKFKDKKCFLLGVIYRGGSHLDGLLSTRVTVDGADATSRIAAMINCSKFKASLQAILIKGVAVAGFNIVDIEELHELTGLPVLVVMRRKPSIKRMFAALRRLKLADKIPLLKKLPCPHKLKHLWIQAAGLCDEHAKELIAITCRHAAIPEALRVGHIIASGVVRGQSRGRA